MEQSASGARHPGEVVAAKYRLDAELGAGGMGVVYRATDLSLQRTVAIKFVHAGIMHARELAVERLRREAQAVARLESHHVAKVFEVGELEDGMPFLVMEHLDGRDLSAVIKHQGPLALSRAIDLLLQACEALVEAHVEGLIHRDLKPSNMFLCHRRDGQEMVKLLDFGIVKLLDDVADSNTLTAALDVIGSIPYMAPEQLKASRYVTARSDIWSLGVVLFTLLSGRLPFAATSRHEVAVAIASGQLLRLSHVQQGVSLGLDEAIGRCLQTDPARRFANVSELANALAPFGTAGAEGSRVRIAHVWAETGPGSETYDTLGAQPLPSAMHRLGPGPAVAQPTPLAYAGPHDTHPTHQTSPTAQPRAIHPPVATAPVRPSRRWLWLAGTAVLLGSSTATFLLTTRAPDATPETTDEPRRTNEDAKGDETESVEAPPPTDGDDVFAPSKKVHVRLGGVTVDGIVKAANKLGFTPSVDSQTGVVVTVNLLKGEGLEGQVQFFTFTDAISPGITEMAIKEQGAVYARDGMRVLVVDVFENAKMERALFDAIVD